MKIKTDSRQPRLPLFLMAALLPVVAISNGQSTGDQQGQLTCEYQHLLMMQMHKIYVDNMLDTGVHGREYSSNTSRTDTLPISRSYGEQTYYRF